MNSNFLTKTEPMTPCVPWKPSSVEEYEAEFWAAHVGTEEDYQKNDLQSPHKSPRQRPQSTPH